MQIHPHAPCRKICLKGTRRVPNQTETGHSVGGVHSRPFHLRRTKPGRKKTAKRLLGFLPGFQPGDAAAAHEMPSTGCSTQLRSRVMRTWIAPVFVVVLQKTTAVLTSTSVWESQLSEPWRRRKSAWSCVHATLKTH